MARRIFDDEHEMFRDSVRAFLKNEIAPHAERWHEQGIVDREAFLKAGEQGLLLMWADEAYGGAGISDFRYEQIFIEENCRYGDVGFFWWLHSRLVGPYIGELGTDEQKARWLPGCVSGESILAVAITEPGAGSDVAGLKTRAEDKGDHYLLNGSKTYISNGINADLVVVVARTDPEKRHGLSLFVVERGMEGFRAWQATSRRWVSRARTRPSCSSTTSRYRRRICSASASRLLSPDAFSCRGAAARSQSVIWPTAEAALLSDDGLHQRARSIRTDRLPDFQNTRFKMADMRTEIDVAQAYVDQCVIAHNEGQLSAADDAAKAKLFTSELRAALRTTCLQLHGGAGYMDEYPISRMYTNARISRIYAGTRPRSCEKSSLVRLVSTRARSPNPALKKHEQAVMPDTNKPPVAFVGLGVMGYPMAGHLAAAGWSRRHRVTTARASQGRRSGKRNTAVRSLRRSGGGGDADAEIVFACVGNDDDVREVTLGAGGVFESTRRAD